MAMTTSSSMSVKPWRGPSWTTRVRLAAPASAPDPGCAMVFHASILWSSGLIIPQKCPEIPASASPPRVALRKSRRVVAAVTFARSAMQCPTIQRIPKSSATMGNAMPLRFRHFGVGENVLHFLGMAVPCRAARFCHPCASSAGSKFFPCTASASSPTAPDNIFKACADRPANLGQRGLSGDRQRRRDISQ